MAGRSSSRLYRWNQPYRRRTVRSSGGVRLEGVGAVAHFQPGLQLLQHLAHLPLGGVEHLRQQEPLRLRRPGIKHPGGQVGQFLHAEGKQGLGRLLIHLHRAGGHLLKQAGKLLRAAL